MLGLATFGGPHLLILDEPTNHLDIDSRAALIEAINDYPGATIIVSHDRHLLDACADRLWLVADRKVTAFDGDLDDYRRHVLADRGETDRSERPKSRRAPPAAGVGARNANAGDRAQTASLRRQLSRAEAEIARLTREIEKLDAALASGELYTRDPAKAAALAKARSEHSRVLAQAEEEWLAAGAALDTAPS
jgi:ATP-binding cassette subfamily F protein 3